MSDPSNDPSSGPNRFDELAHGFADHHPEMVERIREPFPTVLEMAQSGSDLGPETSPFLSGVNGHATVPRVLGEYRLVREIGRGGMGVVYEAVQESLGRHVAVKVLPDGRRLAPNQLERFIREAKAAALLHHTNIVPVFGVGEHEGVRYYAMQYIEGQGLDSVLAEVRRLRRDAPEPPAGRDGPTLSLAAGVAQGLWTGDFRRPGSPADLASTVDSPGPATGGPGEPLPARPEDESVGRADSTSSILGPTEAHYHRSVARLAAQVAEALAHAHAHGILHRDIKPANILMDTQGTAWVTDFGLAKSEGSDELTNPGDIVGTLRFMAPERYRGCSDTRGDVYSLGVTLYEMLTTEPAFAATERAALVDQVMHEEPRRPRAIDPTIPRDLETIVLKAIAREPEARYPSAGELAEDLRRYLTDRPIRARRIGAAKRAWRWARRNPTTAVLAASLAAVFVAGLPLVTALWLRSSHLYRLSEERRADAEASLAQARGAVDDYLTTVSESTLLRSSAPGLQPLRRRLLEAALRYYQEFARRHGDDPAYGPTWRRRPRGSARSPARSGRGTRPSRRSAGPRVSTRSWLALIPPVRRTRPSAVAAWRGWRSSRPTAARTNRRPPTIVARSRCWNGWPRGRTPRPGPGLTWPSPTIISPACSATAWGASRRESVTSGAPSSCATPSRPSTPTTPRTAPS